MCRLLRDGVAAVFGPTNADTSRHVQSVCETVEVPHFRAHWDLDADDGDGGLERATTVGEGGLYSASVYPPYSAVSRSLIDFVVAHDWTRFAVLYDSDDGMRFYSTHVTCGDVVAAILYGYLTLTKSQLKCGHFRIFCN